jgi:CHAT domain-containing protein
MAARRTPAGTADLAGAATAEAALGPGEAMLAVRLTPAGTGVSLLVRHDRVALFPIALAQAAAATLVNTYRQRLASPQSDAGAFDPTEAARLYRTIFGPLDAARALDGVSELFLVPDRTIESIPAAALVIQMEGQSEPVGDARMEPVPLGLLDTVRFLRDRFAITMLPSVEDLAALRHIAPAKAAQPYAGLADPIGPAIGDAIPGRDWPLPKLATTANQVWASQGLLHGQPGLVLTGADATLENLLAVLQRGPFDVIEFATHAISERVPNAPDGVPEPPWLLISPPAGEGPDLAGSFLTLREIAALPMDANLVILSACQTAGSDQTAGEGLLSGLSRAFIRAGARSLIVTYWDAAYPETTGILQQVIAEMAAEPGLSTARAIADATRHSQQRADRLRRLPYFWASLAAVGPRPARLASAP